MLEINMDAVYLLSEDIFLYKIKELEKFWVFNVDSGEHYSLNETSFWILEQVDGKSSLKSILHKYLNEFEIDKKQGEKDFSEIVRNFLNEGIIRNGGREK